MKIKAHRHFLSSGDPRIGERARVNQCRVDVGLKPVKFQNRNCLRCSKEFEAQMYTGNFLCSACRGYKSSDFEP